LLAKGQSKKAAKEAAKKQYMDNQALMDARKDDRDKIAARRARYDVGDDQDGYGNAVRDDFENAGDEYLGNDYDQLA
jgi:hypothetical protein